MVKLETMRKQLVQMLKDCKEIPMIAAEVSHIKIASSPGDSFDEKLVNACGRLVDILLGVGDQMNAEWEEDSRPLYDMKYMLTDWQGECTKYLEGIKAKMNKKRRAAMQEKGESLVRKLQEILQADAAEIFLGAFNVDCMLEFTRKEGTARLEWVSKELATLLVEAEEDMAAEMEVRRGRYVPVNDVMEKLVVWQKTLEDHILKKEAKKNENRMKQMQQEMQQQHQDNAGQLGGEELQLFEVLTFEVDGNFGNEGNGSSPITLD